MRSCLLAICGSLLLGSALPTKGSAQGGLSTEATRELIAVSEMGHSSRPETLPRLLTFEEGDDPTIAGSAISKHDPVPAARKAAQKAAHLAKKGRHEDAVALFREALTIDPQYYEAANNLALELEAAGKGDEAEKVLRGLTKLAPEHVLAFTNLGTLLCQQHRYAEAEAVARQALQHHQYSFKSNFLLGTALVDEGRWTDEAKSKLEYAQVKYPEAKALLKKWPSKSAAN